MCQSPPFILHIRRFRKAKRLTQPGLAAAAGLANKRIWYLEHGRCDPRLSDLIALAEALGSTVEDLYDVRPCTRGLEPHPGSLEGEQAP